MQRRQWQTSRHLKIKVCGLKDVTKALKKEILISGHFVEATARERSAKYSEELKHRIALTYYYSLKTYEYVREHFHKALPNGHTIHTYCGVFRY